MISPWESSKNKVFLFLPQRIREKELRRSMTKQEYYELGGVILDASIRVHRELGAGLLESVYQFALISELRLRDILVTQKVPVPLFYRGLDTGKCFEIDLLVEMQ